MESFNPFSLNGKKILVTGASSGIGRQIAISCSKMGASLLITGRNEERLAQTLGALDGDEHVSVTGDLTVDTDRRKVTDVTDKLDGVVHCAGIASLKPAKMLEQSDIDSVFNTNFSATVLLQSLLLSGKKINKSGSIVIISSIGAKKTAQGMALYSSSKAALIAYADVLAQEVAPRRIRVNCICPAMIWTDIILTNMLDAENHEEIQKKYMLGRYGSPDDVANCVIYLLSDASSWVTATTFDITGGGIVQ